LESTLQGKSYRFSRRGSPPLGSYEYSSSSDIFYLFSSTELSSIMISPRGLRETYVGVRWGLLHEARHEKWMDDLGYDSEQRNN
jgi:hypothetical protein